MELDEKGLEAALHAAVPGGAEVWHWLPQADTDDVTGEGRPHQTAYNVMRAAIEAYLATTTPADPEIAALIERMRFGAEFMDKLGFREGGESNIPNMLEAAASALTSLLSRVGRAEEGWRDIASAPKDGTTVDLWCEPFDAFEVGNACRFTDAKFEGGSWRIHVVMKGWQSIEEYWRPTHWQPLPEPPAIRSRSPNAAPSNVG